MEVVNRKSQVAPSLRDVASRRTYDQLCGLATALDVVGERWTMLIVRDLALGPLRYGELLRGLPGIGDGLLAQRLRHLESEGVLHRRFDPALGAVVYELTDEGERLWRSLIPLAGWGVRRMAPIERATDVRADHLALVLAARFDGTRSVGIHETYELRVGDQPYTIIADDGRVTVERGAADDAAVHIALDVETLMDIGLGRITIDQARAEGRTTLEGDETAIARYSSLLKRAS